MSKLVLKVRQVRELQSRHQISNLLRPSPEDALKLADVDVLTDIYSTASSNGAEPLSQEQIGDLSTTELIAGVKSVLNGEEN